MAEEAILATQQKFVDDIKKASEDGKLTKEEATQALEMAKEYFMSHITSISKEVIALLFDNFNEWLEDLIEAKLGQIKTLR